MAKHNQVGKIGEDIAADFLIGKGFKVVQRNYWKPYGEIDIVSREKSGKLRFIEVKTVSHGMEALIKGAVPHGTRGTYRPEENVHPAKVKRLMRVIQAYLVSHETDADWQFDVVAVFLDEANKTAKVRHLENVILGS